MCPESAGQGSSAEPAGLSEHRAPFRGNGGHRQQDRPPFRPPAARRNQLNRNFFRRPPVASRGQPTQSFDAAHSVQQTAQDISNDHLAAEPFRDAFASTNNQSAPTVLNQEQSESSQIQLQHRRTPHAPRLSSSGRARGRARVANLPPRSNDMIVQNQLPDIEHPESAENIPPYARSNHHRGRGGRIVNSFRYSSGQPRRTDASANEPEGFKQESFDRAQDEKLDTQGEIAEQQMRSNNFECMICCDNIQRASSIWCCAKCYNIFHLKCAIEWCNKSIKSRNEALATAQYPSLGQELPARVGVAENAASLNGNLAHTNERPDSIEWPCPACREVLHMRPGKYKCFCGKVIRPEINRHLVPHSCGQLCGRKRPNVDCPHSCNSICHPGRCNPCSLTSRRSCHCGKLVEERKCSDGPLSCGQVCNKPFKCGAHFCARTCHEGSCGPCNETVTLECRCGRQEQSRLCRDLNLSVQKPITNFSCDQICEKMLDCGNHYCTEKCHPGPNCPSCKLLSQNLRTCPCGSTTLKKSVLAERKLCTDPIPVCDSKCNRLLICGPEKNRHRCRKKCHPGPCPPCKLKTNVKCACKLSSKTVDCALMFERYEDEDRVLFRQVEYTFSCEMRCNKLKSCGRHRCSNKCCQFSKTQDASLHRCDQICNKKLACGSHNCPEVCHPGQCGDCTNIGWNELVCHCGGSILYPPIPCGSKPPVCHRPCQRAHLCGHAVKHECHPDEEKCAPCIVFTQRSCFCGAESKDSVYCYLTGYSCGRTCKRQLACKQHRCLRVCHDGVCEVPNERGPIVCTQPCPVPRYTCKHPCGLTCHGPTSCPISDCKKSIEVTCECGVKVERTECYKVMRDVINSNRLALLSSCRSDQDSIMIDLTKKPEKRANTASGEINLKRLDCDETCSIYKRNKALAEALDIAQPDLKPASLFGEDPLRLLKEATAQDYKFVSATYNSLARFVNMARDSDKRFIFMQFPPAEKLRRELVHELAHHFNCSSESREEEPFRHVVVRAYKNKSRVPDFNIEQLLPVTN